MLILLLVLVIILMNVLNTNALFGNKKEEQKDDISAKDSLALGFEAMVSMLF